MRRTYEREIAKLEERVAYWMEIARLTPSEDKQNRGICVANARTANRTIVYLQRIDRLPVQPPR